MFRIMTSILHSFQIRAEIEKHSIRIYEFPDCDSDEDEEFKSQDSELKASDIKYWNETTKKPFLGFWRSRPVGKTDEELTDITTNARSLAWSLDSDWFNNSVLVDLTVEEAGRPNLCVALINLNLIYIYVYIRPTDAQNSCGWFIYSRSVNVFESSWWHMSCRKVERLNVFIKWPTEAECDFCGKVSWRGGKLHVENSP